MVVHQGNLLMSRTISVLLVINVHLIMETNVNYHVILVVVEQPFLDISITLILKDVKDLSMVVAVVMTTTLELYKTVEENVAAVSIV